MKCFLVRQSYTYRILLYNNSENFLYFDLTILLVVLALAMGSSPVKT